MPDSHGAAARVRHDAGRCDVQATAVPDGFLTVCASGPRVCVGPRARQGQGVVTVLHVIEWLFEDEPRASLRFAVVEYREHLLESARERLRTLIADANPGCTTEDVVVVTVEHRGIVQAAAANETDLIVMGAQGRGGIGLALFGSTTQQVGARRNVPY